MVSEAKTIEVYFDGECPFCSRYVEFLRLKKNGLHLKLIDARNLGSCGVKQLSGFDINEGMVVSFGGSWYFGADAMHILSLLGSPSTTLGKMNLFLFRSRHSAKFIYPMLKVGRRLALKFLRKPLVPK